MEREVAYDFTGGIAARLASTHFSDRQWARLYGAVIESDAELRSQWPWESVGDDAFEAIGHADGLLVGVRSDGTVATASVPDATDTPAELQNVSWDNVSGLTVPQGYRPVGLVPLPRDSGQGFVTACLINGTSDAGSSSGSAWAIYEDASGAVQTFEFSNRYPNAAGEEDRMPRANVAVMWGDRLVLGDVEWLDEEGPFSASNSARYPHGLWLSQPGNPGGWDLLDFVYTGIKDGQGTPRVVGLEPTEQGLLVLTTTGVYLLQGSPSTFDYEEVRPGLGASGQSESGWWPATGAAVWVSEVGQVWHSDGVEFLRIDEPLNLESRSRAAGWAAGWDDFVIVKVADRVFAFRLFGQGGAWTELAAPGGTSSAFTLGPCLYVVDGDGQPWRLNRAADYRGAIDDEPHPVIVASRTFEGGDGHRTSFWRHFGIRAQPEAPDAALNRVTLYAGPALSAQSPSIDIDVDEQLLGGRDELVVPGPGAALEASIELEFSGDVSIEQIAAFFTQSRGSR